MVCSYHRDRYFSNLYLLVKLSLFVLFLLSTNLHLQCHKKVDNVALLADSSMTSADLLSSPNQHLDSTSRKILITGISNDIRRNILFQSAIYWAEEGLKVLYIARAQFDSIPSTVHGPQIPSSEVLAKIRIVYLTNTEEVLKFLLDILTFRDTTPRVILLEELEQYADVARVCATLRYVGECCTAHASSPTFLLAAASTSPPPVVCCMFDSWWALDVDGSSLVSRFPQDSSITRLCLAMRSDGALVLRDVSHVFVKH